MQIIIQEYLKSEVKKMQHQCKNDWQCGYQNALNDVLHIIDELTPIELPSDEEAEKEASIWFDGDDEKAFKEGALWMKEQIKKQNHGQAGRTFTQDLIPKN